MAILETEHAVEVRAILRGYAEGVVDADLTHPARITPIQRIIYSRYPGAVTAAGEDAVMVRLAAAYMAAAAFLRSEERVKSDSLGGQSITFDTAHLDDLIASWEAAGWELVGSMYPDQAPTVGGILDLSGLFIVATGQRG